MEKIRLSLFLLVVGLSLFGLVPEGRSRASFSRNPPPASPEVALGERLFRETRFAQFFFEHQEGPNRPLREGDPSIASLPLWSGGTVRNPYAGKSINCASCHLETEAAGTAGLRTLNDYSVRSPVPFRAEDEEKVTLRNSPTLEGIVRPGRSLHFDGEFATAEDLVVEGWLGRNFGWLKSERETAFRHLASVLRADDGSFPGAVTAYTAVFHSLGVNAAELSDRELVYAAAHFVRLYMESKGFRYDSPFDRFLAKNKLPAAPAEGELPAAFHLRLLETVEKKSVKKVPGFGERELAGMKVFLGRGNCASCHALPDFTDGRFHNIGISQLEYDQVNGSGAFKRRAFPSLRERTALDIENARKVPALGAPERVDLGLWSVFANPALPAPQEALRRELCLSVSERECNDDVLLEQSLGRFKTPGLRNLSRGAPYFHDGSSLALDQAAGTYLLLSMMAKRGLIRNADPELVKVRLAGPDRVLLEAFLRSLEEETP